MKMENETEMETEQFIDYTRQKGIWNPDNQQTDLIIVGAGCSGSWITLCLSDLGFRNLSVVEYDKVELINIPSQIYGLEDVGKYKVEQLAEKILKKNGIKIKAINQKIDEEHKFCDMVNINLNTLVIMAVDNIECRKQIYEELKEMPIKIVDVRFGKEGENIYVIDMTNEEDKKKYEKLLEEPTSEEVCGMKGCSYVSLNIASEVAKIITRLDLKEKYPKIFIREMNSYIILTDYK
jgi:molybdopterin/thiamine biosynthesis adenylyltransferase